MLPAADDISSLPRTRDGWPARGRPKSLVAAETSWESYPKAVYFAIEFNDNLRLLRTLGAPFAFVLPPSGPTEQDCRPDKAELAFTQGSVPNLRRAASGLERIMGTPSDGCALGWSMETADLA
jgi:hypothetical protein